VKVSRQFQNPPSSGSAGLITTCLANPSNDFPSMLLKQQHVVALKKVSRALTMDSVGFAALS